MESIGQRIGNEYKKLDIQGARKRIKSAYQELEKSFKGYALPQKYQNIEKLHNIFTVIYNSVDSHGNDSSSIIQKIKEQVIGKFDTTSIMLYFRILKGISIKNQYPVVSNDKLSDYLSLKTYIQKNANVAINRGNFVRPQDSLLEEILNIRDGIQDLARLPELALKVIAAESLAQYKRGKDKQTPQSPGRIQFFRNYANTFMMDAIAAGYSVTNAIQLAANLLCFDSNNINEYGIQSSEFAQDFIYKQGSIEMWRNEFQYRDFVTMDMGRFIDPLNNETLMMPEQAKTLRENIINAVKKYSKDPMGIYLHLIGLPSGLPYQDSLSLQYHTISKEYEYDITEFNKIKNSLLPHFVGAEDLFFDNTKTKQKYISPVIAEEIKFCETRILLPMLRNTSLKEPLKGAKNNAMQVPVKEENKTIFARLLNLVTGLYGLIVRLLSKIVSPFKCGKTQDSTITEPIVNGIVAGSHVEGRIQ